MPTRAFFRTCAVLAWLLAGMVALQMALLAWGPPPADPAAPFALSRHPAFLLSVWLPFLGIPLAAGVFGAVALARWPARPGASALALLLLAAWAALELGMRGTEVFTVHHLWAGAHRAADPAMQATLAAQAKLHQDLSQGLQLPIALLAAALGLLLGLATWGGSRLQRLLSGLLFAYGALGVLLFLSPFLPAADGAVAWLYPFVRVPDRLVAGLWLWREAAARA